MSFIQGLSGNTVFMIFLTLVLGYAFGRINFAGVKFGTSGVLIVALIFGALGMQVPAIVGTAGLALFLACVGLSAGPSFITNLKANFGAFLRLPLRFWLRRAAPWRWQSKYLSCPWIWPSV